MNEQHDPAIAQEPVAQLATKRVALAFALIVAAAFVAYHRTFDVPFLWDDIANIVDNAALRDLGSLRWARGASRPFAQLSFALNYFINGYRVGGWHAVNLAIHAVSGLVLFDLVRTTLRLPALSARFARGASGIALASAVLWVVHPLHTSAVSYVVHRYESLAGLFYLLTLATFARSVTAANPSRLRGAMALACLLGLATKETLVTAPLLVLLYDHCFVGERLPELWSKRRASHLTLFALLPVVGLLVAFGSRNASQGFGFVDLRPIDYARSELGVLVRYLELAVWPRGLSIDYWDWPVARSIREVALPAALIGAIVVSGLAALRRAPPMAFVALGWLIVLLPTSSLLPLKNELLAERRMYVPLALLIPAAVAGIELASRRIPRAFGAIVVTLSCALVATTIERNAEFRNVEELFHRIVLAHPANVRARYHYGVELAARGAEDEALVQFELAAKDGPTCAVCINNIGTVQARKGRFADAEIAFSRAAKLTPDDLTVQVNLANVLIAQGKWPEALHAQRDVVARDPSIANREKLARILCTAPDARARNGAEAIAIGESAAADARAANATSLRLLETLAAAYAEGGAWNEATGVATALATEATRRGRAPMANVAERMLQQFSAREPWREGPDGAPISR